MATVTAPRCWLVTRVLETLRLLVQTSLPLFLSPADVFESVCDQIELLLKFAELDLEGLDD